MKPSLAILGLLAFASIPTQAANSFFNTGDLIITFQKPGDSDTVYVAMGSAPLLYRGSSAGTAGDYALTKSNIVNISTTLEQAFGPGWASDIQIYMGAVAARSSSGSGVVNGDHARTMYASRPRSVPGTVGAAESAAWDMRLTGANTTGSNNIVQLGNNLETNTTLVAEVLPTTISQIDDKNPFLSVALGIQELAYGAFNGGVQQRGSASQFGSMGGIDNIEFALDLYRIPEFDDSETSGIEVSGTKRLGSFEGTLVLTSDGNISYLVPEPSAVTLAGLAGLALTLRRRRNA
jgi:hypothetical protein